MQTGGKRGEFRAQAQNPSAVRPKWRARKLKTRPNKAAKAEAEQRKAEAAKRQ
jgi:hypothetical protein